MKDQQQNDASKIAQLTPFQEKDLGGKRALARGNMLGGASPVVEAKQQ
jgi:hypothetical protein